MKSSLYYFDESHRGEYVEKELKPFVKAWEESGEFPRELYRAAELGLLGADHSGGTGAALRAMSFSRWS